MEDKGSLAKALFEQGYNCAQSVFGAFAQDCGISQETAMLLASPFGGGMGRMREVCGAVSGMFMAAGILNGYNDPKSIEEKKKTYQMVQELAERFRRENGSIICRELLGIDGKDVSAEPSLRTAAYYKKRPCSCLVECAAGILDSYLSEKAAK